MILWHNPRCSTSRKTLDLLQDRGFRPTVRLYLVDPPSIEELVAVRDMLGVQALAMMRRKEKLFGELGLRGAGEADLLQAMAANPILIERPVLICSGQARIGRPPEAVLELVDNSL